MATGSGWADILLRWRRALLWLFAVGVLEGCTVTRESAEFGLDGHLVLTSARNSGEWEAQANAPLAAIYAKTRRTWGSPAHGGEPGERVLLRFQKIKTGQLLQVPSELVTASYLEEAYGAERVGTCQGSLQVLSCSPIEIQLRCDLEIRGQNLEWDRLKGDFRFTRYTAPEEQQKALEDYTRALQAHPDDYELLFQRSMVHRSLYGHEQAAAGDLERALALAPKDWARRAKANESLDNVQKIIKESKPSEVSGEERESRSPR